MYSPIGSIGYNSKYSSINPTPTNYLSVSKASEISYPQNLRDAVNELFNSYVSGLGKTRSAVEKHMSTTTKEIFSKKAVETSSTSVKGTASNKAIEKNYTINVSQIATKQVNEGTSLNSNEKSFTNGVNTIKLTSGNTEKAISVNVDENDTNEMVLEKMASEINKSNANVDAKIVRDEKTNTSKIKIESKFTGAESNFKIEDKLGNLVNVSGAKNVNQIANDAKFKVNGVEMSSKSNQIKLDNEKLKLDLVSAENKDIKVSVKSDVSNVGSEIRKVIDNYNFLVEASRDNPISSRVVNSRVTKVFENSSFARSMGIKVTRDGTVEVDKEKLDLAIKNEPNRVKRFFEENRISEKLNKVLNDFSTTRPSGFLVGPNYSANGTQSTYKTKGLVMDLMI